MTLNERDWYREEMAKRERERDAARRSNVPPSPKGSKRKSSKTALGVVSAIIIVICVVSILQTFGVIDKNTLASLLRAPTQGVSASSIVATTASQAQSASGIASSDASDGSGSQAFGSSDSALTSSGKKSGNTYVDGLKFEAMMKKMESINSLCSEMVSSLNANNGELTSDQAALYATQVSALKSSMESLKYDSSYKTAVQKAYDCICLMELWVDYAQKGYGSSAQTVIAKQASQCSREDLSALKEALQQNGVSWTTNSSGGFTYRYFDY